MSRFPLRPVNLNLMNLSTASSNSKTRPSTSRTPEEIMAADTTDPCPNVGLNSPMTNLAMNMSELTTRRATPRRRLSLSSVDTPPSDDTHASLERTSSSASSNCSTESGVFVDSPTPIDSPTLESSFRNRKKTIAFRRINSQPPPTLRLDCESPTEFLDAMETDEQCCSAPVTSIQTSTVSSSMGSDTKINLFLEDGGSQDSGVGLDKDLGFKVPAPVACLKRKSKLNDIFEETCSPLKYSPVKSPQKRTLSFSLGSFRSYSLDGDSPIRLKRSSLTLDEGAANDDGFLDLGDQEVTEICDHVVPQGLSSLMNDPVIEPSGPVGEPGSPAVEHSGLVDDATPVSRKILPAKRFLRRSQSVDIRSKRGPEALSSQSKRWKSEKSHDDSYVCTSAEMPTRRLHRSHSETAEMIMAAVHRMAEEPDLIADSSKPYILPTVNGKHQDLKSITPETLSMLMNGEFEDEVEEFHILDCRYPYEFEGGHIQNARNIYTREELIEEYLKNPKKTRDPEKRFLMVFHCEFSSERGPSLYRFLRSQDRESNKECYPTLHYPEIYVLEGGYKAFFEHNKVLCEPQTYTHMLHKDYAEDLRKFRAKAKSWSGEKSGHRTGLRTLKF